MEKSSNLGKSLFITFGFFFLVFLASFLIGKESMMSCLAALIVAVIAGVISFLPLILKKELSIIAILSASGLRLLLMLAGSAIIVLFIKVNVLWFFGWLGLFYLTLLFWEIYFALQLAKNLS